MQTPYGLVFNSRTIQADGTVCTSKEYLCNFCQFKVSTAAALLDHSSTHLFGCNHCAFRSTSRLECLLHKRDAHASAADELAGFEDLDHPTLVLKTARYPRLPGNAFMPLSSPGARFGASSLVPPRTAAGMSLLNAAGSSGGGARPLSTATCILSPSSNVVRTMAGKSGDSYFTYRIAHDADGRVQSYECDICGFRSVHINEMFAHASTHSLADLAKSGAATVNNVLWECFYCSFSAPLQASVVSHVIASHPNQPIQLKRLPTTPAGGSGKSVSESTSPSKSVPSSPVVSPQPAEQQSAAKTTPAAADESGKLVEGRVEKKKKSDAGDEGCIWGCYYCSMQSASRNDIIGHLKKQHSSEKLVVTRRRITHVAMGSSSGGVVTSSPSSSSAGVSSSLSEPSVDAAEMLPASGSEPSAESTTVEESDKTGPARRTRKRNLSASTTGDVQQTVSTSDVVTENESSDGSLSVGGSASAKSRRKQMAPRKVADELMAAAVAASGAEKPTGEAVTSHAATGDKQICETLPTVAGTSNRSLLASVTLPRKTGRSNTSKYDNLIKKLKLAEVEESGLGLGSLLDKPRLEEPPKTSSRSSHGKALSLLTGQVVSGYVQPPNGIPTLSPPGQEHQNGDDRSKIASKSQSSGLKVSVVKYVDKKLADRSQSYVYDGKRLMARCGVCGTTACGSDVLRQIREHVAAHFDECRWACTYCTFQCNRRASILGHVSQRHRGQPLRVVRRRNSRNGISSDSTPSLTSPDVPADAVTSQKLRGPRCRRDQAHILATSVMWQCTFCSRRSLFHGLIAIHMKLAHFEQIDNLRLTPQRWIRPTSQVDVACPDVSMKRGQIRLVRIEDVARYPSLSDVILSNGADLIRLLDTDYDLTSETDVASGDVAEFRCTHCHFRGAAPSVVKCHILQTHRSEEVTVLDLRSTRQPNHEHLLMCRSVECQFVTTSEKELRAHVAASPSHATNSVAHTPRSSDRLRRLSPQSKTQTSEPVVPTTVSVLVTGGGKTRRAEPVVPTTVPVLVTGGGKTRRGTDGPIEYNDDGTLKGLELGARASSMKIQCTHCCLVMFCDVDEMRTHLSSAHPRLVPLAIDVECTDTSLAASLFFCLVADCHFITSYYNVYKHHMDEEHPDSETGVGSRPHRAGLAVKRRSAPTLHRTRKPDRSFSANVRRPKKPAGLLNSSVDNGHYSPFDDVSFLALNEDGDGPAGARKPASSHSSHYSSQEFDFSRRYKCVLCSETSATLAEMKSHLTSRHDSTTSHQCVDRRARQLRKRQGIYFCPDANCAFCCKFDEELAVHVEQEHLSLAGAPQTPKPSKSQDGGCAGDRVYQCSHCTYITTDLRNVRVHVVAEHATTDGGFAEIKTAVSSDGSLIMNVNDAVSSKSPSVEDQRVILENGDNAAAGAGSSVKVDDEGKVFAVL